MFKRSCKLIAAVALRRRCRSPGAADARCARTRRQRAGRRRAAAVTPPALTSPAPRRRRAGRRGGARVAAAPGAPAPAAAASAPAMVSAALTPGAPASAPVAGTLDGRIQDVKTDVIKLNRDLLVLEEELLFPANTQVALFVSMDVGKMFELDSVQVKLDDKVVANYLYTALEVEALHRGGVQRVYLGNLKTGQHELVAFFTGKGPHERDYKRGANVKFEKTHRGQVHRAAHPGLDRQAAARVRRQALAVTDHDAGFARSPRASHRPRRRCGGGVRAAGARRSRAWPFGDSAPAEPTHEIKAPHYGDALFYFFQDRYFTSVTTLMASQQFDRVAAPRRRGRDPARRHARRRTA